MKHIFTCLILIILICLSSSAQNISSTCSGASQITFLTPTPLFTVSGNPDIPTLSGCTSDAIVKEGWFYFTAQSAYSIITFQNTGTSTGYVYIYSGTCGSLTYLTCNKAAPGKACLLNFATVNATKYYLRVINLNATNIVSGALTVMKNSGSRAILCRTDSIPYTTGSVDADGKIYDNDLVVGINNNIEMGWAKFNTDSVPKNGINVTGMYLITTCHSKYTGEPDFLPLEEGSYMVISSMLNSTIDPVTASASDIFYEYGTLASFVNVFTNLDAYFLNPETTYCYTLNDFAILDFTNVYTQNWWALNIQTQDPGWSWIAFAYINYYGWNSKAPPYIVVTYDIPCVEASFATQPISTSPKCSPASASFTANANGDGPIFYQWQVLIGSWVNISDGGTNPIYSGATSNTLNVSNATATMQYRCIATNCSSTPATSNSATLNVVSKPIFNTNPVSDTKCSGLSTSFTVSASSNATLSYQWNKNGSAITGATTGNYQLSNINSSDAANYTCIVYNTCESATSTEASLTVNTPPIISVHPVSTAECAGTTFNFSVTVSGTNPLTYQWNKNGSNIAGATTNNYQLSNLSSNDAANYTCIISNLCGSVTSTAGTLTVNTIPSITLQPAGASQCAGSNVFFSIVASSATTLSYQWTKNSTPISNATYNFYILNGIGSGDAANYTCLISNLCGTVTSNAAALVVNIPPTVSISPVNPKLCSGTDITFTTTTEGSSPFSYKWFKSETEIISETNSSFNINNISPGNASNYKAVVINSCGSTTSNTSSLTVINPVAITSSTPDLTKCEGENVVFEVIATGDALSFQWQKNNNPIIGATNSNLQLNPIIPADAGNYSCEISNFCNTIKINTSLTVKNKTVFLDTIPNQTKCQGESITFSVNAAGDNLSYQWTKGAGDIIGATNSTYSINNLKQSDFDVYSCKVINICGPKPLPKFILTVVSPPTSNIKFTKHINYAGDPFTITLSPGGTGPFSYQWIKDGNNITGETNNTYNINSLTCTDGGVYSCKIDNSCSTVNADIVDLYILNCGCCRNTISGYVKYDNKDSTLMSSHTANTITTVYLKNSENIIVDSVNTDDTGFYVFVDFINGSYKLSWRTKKAWGGSNPLDALIANRNYIGLYPITDPMKMKAADINNDGKRNPLDALMINRRYIGVINKFVDKNKITLSDWLFEEPTLTVNSEGVSKNIKAICLGDVNADYKYIPAKIAYKEVNSNRILYIKDPASFDLPVYLNDNTELGAMGIKLKMENGKLKIIGIKTKIKGLIYNIIQSDKSDESDKSDKSLINIAWSAKDEAYYVNPDKPLLYIQCILNTADIVNLTSDFMISNESIITDIDANYICTDKLVIPKIDINNLKPETWNLKLNAYPNPFSDLINIDYTIPEDGNVEMNLYNVLGEKIVSLITNERQQYGEHSLTYNGSQLSKGVYYCVLRLTTTERSELMNSIIIKY